MKYQWKKALANALLVFIGCFLAKIPAGDTFMWNWPELKHVLITCGTITLFAELRYIYSALSRWADTSTNGGNMKTAAMLLFALLFAGSAFGQAPKQHGKHTIHASARPFKVMGHAVKVAAKSTVKFSFTAFDAAVIDPFGVALQALADGVDMFIAQPLEALPLPLSKIGEGVHYVYLGVDKIGEQLAK